MGNIKSYRDLIVWQRSMNLAKRIHEGTRFFPREEAYGLTSQIRRAAVSVAANTAEGAARSTTGEFRQQIGVARGSLAELETLLLLVKDPGYGDAANVDSLLVDCDEVSRLQSGLLKSLANK